MISITLSPTWLINILGPKQTEPSPQLHCEQGKATLTVFFDGGVGMRSIDSYIPSQQNVTFEISPALHAFVKRLTEYPLIEFRFEHGAMTIIAETPHAALRYMFPRIHKLEAQCLDSSEKDMTISVSAKDWLLLCRALSNKGLVTITATTDSKVVTMKHSGNRWGAAIHAKATPKEMKTFTCQAGSMRETFLTCTPETSFADITFMDIGVLKWVSGLQTVYIAPYKEDE
jgi:hypothetical protein